MEPKQNEKSSPKKRKVGRVTESAHGESQGEGQSELCMEHGGPSAMAHKQSELPNRIRLDVGGTVFATTLSTLTMAKGTFFETMFGGRWSLKPEPDGSFFIDRDPKGFPLVLKCLRGHRIDPNTISAEEMAAFNDDLDYYSIPRSMVEKCFHVGEKSAGEHFSADHKSDCVTLSDDNLEVSINSVGPTDDDHHYVLGANLYKCPDHVAITIQLKRDPFALKLGVLDEITDEDLEDDIFGYLRKPFSFAFYGFSRDTRWEAGKMDVTSRSPLPFLVGDIVEVEIDSKHHKLTVRNTTHNVVDSMVLPPTFKHRLAVAVQTTTDADDDNSKAIVGVRIMSSKHVQ